MNEKIVKVKSKIERCVKKAEDLICRPFDVTFSLRKRSKPESPVVTVNVKGEVPKKALLFLSVIGVITTAIAICKTVKFFKELFD